MRVDFQNLPYRASDALKSLADRITGIAGPEILSVSIRTTDLHPDSEPTQTKIVDSWLQRGCRFIYYIWCDASAEQLGAIRSLFTAAKAEERDSRAYAR